MGHIATALTPIFLLILLGHLCKRRGWVADAFWAPAEKLTFYLFFPALLLNSTATSDLGQDGCKLALFVRCCRCHQQLFS